MKNEGLPSRIEGEGGMESSTMVDEFCKDLYDFLDGPGSKGTSLQIVME